MVPENFVEVGVRLHLLVTGWVGVGLLLIAALLLVGYLMTKDGPGYDAGGGFFISGVFVAGAGLLMGAIWVATLWPYSGEYHRVYRVEGHVETVTNVISEASGDLTRTPVLELDTVDRPITMTDPRAVSLEGHDVTLTCWINWNYQAQDTYECSIYEIGEAR